MPVIRKTCLTFCCISLLFFYIKGQNTDYHNFENIIFNSESSVANFIMQDSQEVIWIGSNIGLYSYDGYSLQAHYSHEDNTGVRIHCGQQVSKDLLYLGTDNGILIYNLKTDSYETSDIQFPSNIRALLLDGNKLWIGSLNGLYAYDIVKNSLSDFSIQNNPGLPHQAVYSIIHSADGNLYIGTYNGLCRYLTATNTFENIELPSYKARSNQFVNSLLEDSLRNCIWIGTEGYLYKYDSSLKSVEQLKLFKGNSIKSLALDKNNKLLLATDNGLFVYDDNSDFVQHIVHDSRDANSLSNNIVWNIFVDREKNIWLGTDYGISLNHYNASYRFIPINQITGIGDGNQFYVLFKDSRGNFWYGGNNGLILSPAEKKEKEYIWYRMGDPKHPLYHNRIRDIYEDKDKNLWIATDGSINRYDYETQQFISYNITDKSNNYHANWAYCIFEDNNNNLWIASYLGGVFVVNKQRLINSTSESYTADYHYSTASGLSGNSANRIIPDKHGNVWVHVYGNGINKIDVSNNKVSRIPIENAADNKAPIYILGDSEGFIWIGFRTGLLRINPTNNEMKFVQFTAFNDSEILSMVEEGKHIWISTANGILVLDKSNFEVQRLNVKNKIFTSSFFDKESGYIYMGGVDGFAMFLPEILKNNISYSPIILTALYVNDQLFRPGVDYDGKSIRYIDKITLKYYQNNIAFEFSDLLFSREEKDRFIYRMENLDDEWKIVTQNTNRISYSNLKYGSYRLEIRKLEANGSFSESSLSFYIEITPPWYYSLWAKCIYLLLLFGLVLWTINFFRVKNRLKIEHIEKEKLSELTNLKMNFFTDISHELKTPLSMIIAPISKILLETKSPVLKKQLEAIQKNALKLNQLTHQLLDFNRIDSDSNATLILSNVEFVSFAKSILSSFEEGYKEKNLTFSFNTNRDSIYLNIDILKMESVLTNLLSNAKKFSKEQGSIELNLNYSESDACLSISVSDDGVGITSEDLPYVFQRFYQSKKTSKENEGTGIGLYLVKNYVKLHGGSIEIHSEEGKGSIVKILLPLLISDEISNINSTDEISEETLQDNKNTILIVDDNIEIATFIEQILNPTYQCYIAQNGKIGLEMAKEIVPDLIIGDIMMPVMDGLEMSRQLKKQIPLSTIPIILLTAKDDKNTELESIKLNVDAFISKPFDSAILLSRIEQLLRNKQQIKAKLRLESLTTPQMPTAISSDEKLISKITKIIEDNISDPDLNVNALCEISGISSKQIYRKIKQLTGLSPVEYIKSIRMKKAAMLLSQNKFSIAEAMYMVGFSNHSYFAKCFQAEFGKTPKQFTEQATNNLSNE